MKFIPLFALVLVAALSLSLQACKNTLDSATGQSSIVFPSSNVSYSKQVQPLFNITCTYSGCHDDGTQAGGLSLTNYFSLISTPGVVVPKDTTHSILIQRIEGLGPIMPPPPFSPLNANQIQGIKTWVIEGAKYN
jgi:hypothetical protein